MQYSVLSWEGEGRNEIQIINSSCRICFIFIWYIEMGHLTIYEEFTGVVKREEGVSFLGIFHILFWNNSVEFSLENPISSLVFLSVCWVGNDASHLQKELNILTLSNTVYMVLLYFIHKDIRKGQLLN